MYHSTAQSPGSSDLKICWTHLQSLLVIGHKAGTGLGALRDGDLVGPFFKGSYNLKSPSQIALVVLVSAGYLNDCPEQGIVFNLFFSDYFLI